MPNVHHLTLMVGSHGQNAPLLFIYEHFVQTMNVFTSLYCLLLAKFGRDQFLMSISLPCDFEVTDQLSGVFLPSSLIKQCPNKSRCFVVIYVWSVRAISAKTTAATVTIYSHVEIACSHNNKCITRNGTTHKRVKFAKIR